MARVIILLCTFVFAAVAGDLSAERAAFNDFLRTYGKSYSPAEQERRFETFKRNLRAIESHNQRGATWTAGVNQFTDMTADELRRTALPIDARGTSADQSFEVDVSAPLPASWDWRSKGCVTPVSNQGQCDEAGIVSAVEAIESCHCIQTAQLVELSTQQIIDCASGVSCNGDILPGKALEYVKQNGGIDTEACYPSTGTVGTCHYNRQCCASTVNNVTVVQKGNETALQAAVYQGPTAALVDASTWQMYEGGIYSDPSCSASMLDHSVLVVGWGSQGGQDYWIVKNSWGTNWGLNGYILLARNKHNMCGIASQAVAPKGCGKCA